MYNLQKEKNIASINGTFVQGWKDANDISDHDYRIHFHLQEIYEVKHTEHHMGSQI